MAADYVVVERADVETAARYVEDSAQSDRHDVAARLRAALAAPAPSPGVGHCDGCKQHDIHRDDCECDPCPGIPTAPAGAARRHEVLGDFQCACCDMRGCQALCICSGLQTPAAQPDVSGIADDLSGILIIASECLKAIGPEAGLHWESVAVKARRALGELRAHPPGVGVAEWLRERADNVLAHRSAMVVDARHIQIAGGLRDAADEWDRQHPPDAGAGEKGERCTWRNGGRQCRLDAWHTQGHFLEERP